MKIDRQQCGSVEVMTVKGALTEDDALRFAGEMKRRLASPNPRLVLDLGEVPCVDSVALEALLEASDYLDDMGFRLRLAGVAATVREIFQLTGLSPKFQFFEKVDDAVRSFL